MHVMATAEAGAPAHQLPGGPQPEGGPEEPPSQFAAKVAAQGKKAEQLVDDLGELVRGCCGGSETRRLDRLRSRAHAKPLPSGLAHRVSAFRVN